MKMTLKEVRKNLDALNALGGIVFPVKLNFTIGYNLEKLQKEFERAEKQRLELCRQYAEKNEEGNPIMQQSNVNGQVSEFFKMSPENEVAFKKEYDDLMETEVDIEIRTVAPEVIERCEQAERYNVPTVAQLLGMSFMIEDAK